jgi:ribA/ribD-fused uncharacterized protein
VTPFDNVLWDQVVCGVAVAVIYQKFAQVPDLKQILLLTEDKILCEATAHDTNRDIGINIQMDHIYNVPARWEGSNILGWVLMEVRAILCKEEQEKEIQRSSTN